MNQISIGRYATGKGTGSISGEIDGHAIHLSLNLNRPSERYIFECHQATGAYEPETINAILEHLKEGDTFFDVGAHCGYFSAIAKAKVGDGSVVAFEPDEDNCRAIERNAKARVIRAVVGRENGEAMFFTNFDNDGGNALWNPARHPFNETTARVNAGPKRRPMVCLNAFTARKPSVIKIDTEGAEAEVLKGAVAILAQPQLKLVVMECNPFGLEQMGSSPEELHSLMAAHGFMAETTTADAITNLFFTRL